MKDRRNTDHAVGAADPPDDGWKSEKSGKAIIIEGENLKSPYVRQQILEKPVPIRALAALTLTTDNRERATDDLLDRDDADKYLLERQGRDAPNEGGGLIALTEEQ